MPHPGPGDLNLDKWCCQRLPHLGVWAERVVGASGEVAVRGGGEGKETTETVTQACFLREVAGVKARRYVLV